MGHSLQGQTDVVPPRFGFHHRRRLRLRSGRAQPPARRMPPVPPPTARPLRQLAQTQQKEAQQGQRPDRPTTTAVPVVKGGWDTCQRKLHAHKATDSWPAHLVAADCRRVTRCNGADGLNRSARLFRQCISIPASIGARQGGQVPDKGHVAVVDRTLYRLVSTRTDPNGGMRLVRRPED